MYLSIELLRPAPGWWSRRPGSVSRRCLTCEPSSARRRAPGGRTEVLGMSCRTVTIMKCGVDIMQWYDDDDDDDSEGGDGGGERIIRKIIGSQRLEGGGAKKTTTSELGGDDCC